MIATSLRRGLAAGLLAGLLAGFLGLVIGEPSLAEAIRLEEAGTHAAEPAVVSRSTQVVGLVAGLAIVGVTLGGLFGAALAALRPRLSTSSEWVASLGTAAAAWVAISLVPALKYPAMPPGVGDGATVGTRTGWYLGTIALGLVVAVGVWLLARRGERLAAVALGAGAVVVVLAAFPERAGAGDLPADLVWDFRVASLAIHAALWLGVGALYAVFTERGRA